MPMASLSMSMPWRLERPPSSRDANNDFNAMNASFFCLFLTLLGLLSVVSADIVEAEYFLNADPGQGNGTAISIVGDGTTLDVEVDPDLIAALPFGFHVLAVRVRNDLGEWSNSEIRAFNKPDPNVTPMVFPNSTIAAAEYFINEDPGQGSGTAISLTGNGTRLDVEVDPALIAALENGNHTLGVRFQNALGLWSNTEYRQFLKGSAQVADPTIDPLVASLEYQWFQNNVAVTPARTVSAVPAARRFSFQELASLAGLSEGGTFQILFTPIDTEGRRGFGETRTVEIQTTDSDGDGVPDLWENTFGFNPNDSADLLANNDLDNDGVSDIDEFRGGSNPTLEDTDGDGISDSVEINLSVLGLDPAVPNPELAVLINGSLTDGLSLSDIRRLKPGAPLLLPDPETGKFTLTLEYQTSADLESVFEAMPLSAGDVFITDGGTLEVEITPTPGDVRAFYRIETDG